MDWFARLRMKRGMISRKTLEMKARNDRSRDTAKAYLRSRIERGSALLVVVEFRLKALVAESNAVDRLVKVRAAQAEELPHIGTMLAIDSAERNALRGHYRYFDLSNDVALVNTNDARYAPSWMLLPDAQRGIYLLETGGPKKVFGGTRAAKPWRQTCQTNKGFTGLLDVGVPVNVGLLFTVPKAAKLDVLKLQVGEVEPVALTAK